MTSASPSNPSNPSNPLTSALPVVASRLGRVGYLDGWRLQETIATRLRSGAYSEPERILFLEHDPVYTIGRSGSVDHLLIGLDEARALGTAVYQVDRGGDITYHGPGQLVGYPVLRLGDRPDLVRYVRGLEEALIEVLGSYGIGARAERGKTGVWVDLPDRRPAKIAAIGVRVSRGVSTHGFALNVSTDLAAFTRMVPCGFIHEVASLERLGVAADVTAVAGRVADALARRLGRELVWGGVPPVQESEIPADAPVRGAVDLTRRIAAA